MYEQGSNIGSLNQPAWMVFWGGMDLGYLFYSVLDQKFQLTPLVNSLYQGSIPSVQDYFCSIFTLSYLLFHLHFVH